jgi:hypothetical protein
LYSIYKRGRIELSVKWMSRTYLLKSLDLLSKVLLIKKDWSYLEGISKSGMLEKIRRIQIRHIWYLY